MEKEALLQMLTGTREAWEAVLAELGAAGLERPGATGEWRVRDVLAHCNGWDRWQMVQLRCAFSGEEPTQAELLGGIAYPPNDNMHEDAMNAMFIAGTRDLPLEEILRHWREVFALRVDWVAAATQEQLDAVIGADWGGGSQRVMRLASEVPSVSRPTTAGQFVTAQVEHLREHLQTLRAWMGQVDLGLLRLVPGQDGDLFALYHEGLAEPARVGLPSFEVDGRARADFVFQALSEQRDLPHGGRETWLRYSAGGAPGLELAVIVRSFAHSPILRFKYRLSAGQPAALTQAEGAERLRYFSLRQAGLHDCALAEYQLSHFDPVQHSYMPNREDRRPDEAPAGLAFAGPVALFHSARRTLLAAYEHGADHPLSFFDFSVAGEAEQREVALRARQGNTYPGQPVSEARPWESVWFELGLHPGGLEDFLPLYRRFFLEEVCENRESRRPYIFYNTWNYQERQKYFRNRPYIESMTAERMLDEIDVAHRLGVEVFVVDTGWYIKTGDWLPNLEKFPEGLREIKRRLDGYGMKLGLWFNPTVAALTSRVFQEHPEWEMTWEGQPRGRHPIWETEVSGGMCLASDYAETYADVMVRLNQELGVSYFKWDAVQQYGCDSPLHNHGTEANTPRERRDSYAYQMGIAMIRIVEEVTRRCPGVIVDFDITEGGRFVGLGFLSAGKYFLVNNGPYFHDFDIPRSVKIDPDTINVFFYPGPARPRICRQGIKYDELIPSILFLTHYLPDGPRLAQANSLASLVLGGNGWWGDLPALGEADLEYLGGQIALYKQVRECATRAFPRRRGFAGSSPEIYEKIDPGAGGGLVAFFTVTPGTLTHFTQPLDLDRLVEVVGADAWEPAAGGRLKLTVTLARDEARVVYLVPRSAE